MSSEDGDMSKGSIAKSVEMRGETCPLPEIEAKLWLRKLAEGEVLEMFFDDPLGAEFFPRFCEKKGYPYMMIQPEGSNYWHLLIMKR